MNRAEHLEWAKQRALEYVDRGQLDLALTSMLSDLRKHPETENHVACDLGVQLSIHRHLATPEKMREFINGFR